MTHPLLEQVTAYTGPGYEDTGDEQWWRDAVGATLRGFTFRQRAQISLGGDLVEITPKGRDFLMALRSMPTRGTEQTGETK